MNKNIFTKITITTGTRIIKKDFFQKSNNISLIYNISISEKEEVL
jgi:hypothetical protein